MARIKQRPEDFQVAEILGFTPDGDGEHLWCYVEKCGMNTAWLKRHWAQISGCPGKDIAHSGLKDRHAVTRQWLSLPARYGEALPDRFDGDGEYWRILERCRHRKKLRPGTHKSNEFTIRIREIESAARPCIDGRLQQIQRQGFPNHFAAQRFGRDNLAAAQQQVRRGVLPRNRALRARTLSTLRSEAFNRQLQHRLAAGKLWQVLTGDCLMLRGSRSHFFVETVDDTLRERMAGGDLSPCGYLPGAPAPAATGEAGGLRAQALADFAPETEYLLRYCEAGWRAFVVRAENMRITWEDGQTLCLQFRLPRGSYATALLDEVFESYDD